MELDAKEKMMISHYSSIFTDYNFDEYDVLGFLIVVPLPMIKVIR